MARGKSTKLKPFQKLLTIMISGKPVTLEEMNTLLGNEIYMYRISTYMWHIKTNANGVIKPIKDGRKVTGYQLVNSKDVQEYMTRNGIGNFTPSATPKKDSISKLADLKAKPAPKVVTKKTKTKEQPTQPEVVESSSDEMVITEITQ